MIVTPEEMALIKERPHGRQPRRMMRLPVTYNDEAMKRPCPMRVGKSYTLQTDRKGEPCQVFILVISVREERLGELLESDSRREGYKSREAALEAYYTRHGPFVADNGQVWAISFQVVMEPITTLDQPVFLSKVGDYTTLAGRQAVPGDPEVCIIPGEGEQARVMALAARQGPAYGAINRATREVESLRESLTGMKARNRAALIARELVKLQNELPVSEVVRSA